MELFIDQYADGRDLDGEVAKKFHGRTISKIEEAKACAADALLFTFTDGSQLALVDTGQDCCANHHFDGTENLSYWSGADLLGFEVTRAGTSVEDTEGWRECHETEFLDIRTSKGVLTISAHNEHNGYYSGISLNVVEIF